MNKNEFYKELMKQYTFDEDKIRRDAKRIKNSPFYVLNSKWLPLASAAAVFVTVFGGYLFLMSSYDNTISDPYFSAPTTHSQRIFDAENQVQILTAEPGVGLSEVYLSFEAPMSFSEIEYAIELLSDTGEIEILKVYDESAGGFISKDGIDSTSLFPAAKISAPGSMLPAIKEMNSVVIVEFASDTVNDDTFTPITKQDVEQANTVTAPAVTTQQEPPLQTAPKQTLPKVETEPKPESATTAATEEDLPETTFDDELFELPEITPAEEESLTNPAIEMIILSLNIEKATAVQFVNNDHFFVFTDNSVELYRILSEPYRDFEMLTALDVCNPKISNINYDEGVFLITGEDYNGIRSKLFVVNGVDSTLVPVDMNLSNEELAYSYYQDGFIISKTKSYNYESFYRSVPNDSGSYDTTKLCDFEIQAALLSLDGNSFIYALADDSETKLFHYNISTSAMVPINFSVKERAIFVRSFNLTNFAIISNEGTWVYNAANNRFIPCGNGTNIEFAKSDVRYFKMDGAFYMISGEEVISVDEMPYEGNIEISSNLYGLFSMSDYDVKIQVY